MLAKIAALASGIGRRIVAWWWRRTRGAWAEAWREPFIAVRALGLVCGLAIWATLVR